MQIVPYGAVVAKACEYLNDACPSDPRKKPRGEKLKVAPWFQFERFHYIHFDPYFSGPG